MESVFRSEGRNDCEIDLFSIDFFSFLFFNPRFITINDIKTASSSVRNCWLQTRLLLFYPLSFSLCLLLFHQRIPKTRILSRQQSCTKLVFIWKSNFSTMETLEKGSNEPSNRQLIFITTFRILADGSFPMENNRTPPSPQEARS